MVDAIDTRVLANCTILAVNRFPWSPPFYNESTIFSYNRTSILELLKYMIEISRQDDPQEDSIRLIELYQQKFCLLYESQSILTFCPFFTSWKLRQFMTECLYPSSTLAYELPWEQKTIWGVIFGAMLFIAITGNCIVLWIVLGECGSINPNDNLSILSSELSWDVAGKSFSIPMEYWSQNPLMGFCIDWAIHKSTS